MRLIGLRSCDTCRAARRALEAAGHEPDVRDLREEPLDRAEIAGLYETFGAALVNRRSTTWRGLDLKAQGADPVDLIATHPTVMKRPVILDGEAAYLGWTPETRCALGL